LNTTGYNDSLGGNHRLKTVQNNAFYNFV